MGKLQRLSWAEAVDEATSGHLIIDVSGRRFQAYSEYNEPFGGEC